MRSSTILIADRNAIPFPVGVDEGHRIVACVGVSIPALWVSEQRPCVLGINGDETAGGGAVVAGAEVVKRGFAVAFFSGEFVVLRAGVGDGRMLAAEGVEVGVETGCGEARLQNGAGGTEVVGEVVEDVSITSDAAGNALAVEEDVLLANSASEVAFRKRVAARARSVEAVVGCAPASLRAAAWPRFRFSSAPTGAELVV